MQKNGGAGLQISDKQELKRQKIIAAASELFVENGISRTSLADIAGKLGISKGTLYYYYATKNDLIFDITERHMREITDNLFALIDSDDGESTIGDILTILVERILNAETRSRLHLHLIREAMAGNLALKARFETTYKNWFDLAAKGFGKVLPEGKEFSILAPILVAVLDGLVIQSTLGVHQLRTEDAVRLLVRMAGG